MFSSFLTITLSAQTDTTIYLFADSIPRYKHGEEQLASVVSRNIRYPKFDRNTGRQGTVLVSFVIDTMGKLSDFKVIKGVGVGCGIAAVEALETTSQNWIPAYLAGKKVAYRMNYPVRFTVRPPYERQNLSEADSLDLVKIYTAEYYFRKGVKSFENNRMEESRDYFAKAIEFNPKDSESLYNRGIINRALGHDAEACVDFKLAGKLGDSKAREEYEKCKVKPGSQK
ncbi:MAG: TonB family protein [Bacteroidota bacterium]